MSKSKINLTSAQLKKALVALKQMVDKPMQEDRSNIDACIQRFEFSVELFWKFLKRVLEDRGVEVTYPKDVVRTAFSGKLIDDEAIWLNMLDDRNLTSHAYDETLADQIFDHIPQYYEVMWQTLLRLAERVETK